MDEVDIGLFSISPLDGRYRKQVEELQRFTSEAALIGYRIRVEAAWLQFLCRQDLLREILKPTDSVMQCLEELKSNLPMTAYRDVKAMEAKINHDVKAVEYYLRGRLAAAQASPHVLAFIHFACTSEDINNLAYSFMFQEAKHYILQPQMNLLVEEVGKFAQRFADQPMLARTHGQPASPTTIGKEFAVFGHRLHRQMKYLNDFQLEGKFNGAVGNFNAHVVAFPEVNWQVLANEFVKSLGFRANPLTTQIENHDSYVEAFQFIKHYNSVLIGFTRDLWGYIALGMLRQKIKESEVGSSTMPHKVNPIDFENAEGNLGLANSLITHFTDKLLISRWQRDLSDSTVLRSTGSVFAYSLLAYKSVTRGLRKLTVDTQVLDQQLGNAWEVLAEPVQTVMRRYGVIDAYERMKDMTRGRAVTQEDLNQAIDSCEELPTHAKSYLKSLVPRQYLGLAPKLTRDFCEKIGLK